jgi:hypothetical protein
VRFTPEAAANVAVKRKPNTTICWLRNTKNRGQKTDNRWQITACDEPFDPELTAEGLSRVEARGQ